jgi:uncharacterized RDD family membrane protein YckC
MNIKEIFNKNSTQDSQKNIYASSIKRSLAIGIDIWIVLFLRAFALQLMGMLFLNKMLKNYVKEFFDYFGTETMKATPEHINFLLHHSIFYWTIFTYAFLIFIGAFYHAYLNSSAWQATIGKRLMKIIIVRNDMSQIGLYRGFFHYFLSILPFAYIVYLASWEMTSKGTMLEALTHNAFSLALGIMFVLWLQIHLFMRKKTTAYDLICDTILINGKTDAKFPFKK